MGRKKEKEVRIIGFYTNDALYSVEAEKFKDSLEKFGLLYHLYEVPSKNSWYLNCAQKSKVLLNALEQFEEDILYLDVDARVIRKPTFNTIRRDIPNYCVWFDYHNKRTQLASGTIYFPNNQLSKEVLRAWIDAQEAAPSDWDQVTLQSVYKRFPYAELHHDWINIESAVRESDAKLLTYIETDNPIILHTQASRRWTKVLRQQQKNAPTVEIHT